VSLVKSTSTVAFFTLISRISGFLRDVMMANLIGASWLSDAFFVAFKLPNFFRRLFAEGAFNVAFIPSFSGILTSDGKEAALKFAGEVMSVLFLVLLVLNAIFILFMPWITPLFAPGFADTPEKFDLTVTLSQITFPYILFISLVSLLGGVLNSFGKFAAPAASPILLNLCMIAGMLFLTNTPTPAHALSWSVLAAGIVQLIWLMAICLRHDMLPGLFLPKLTPKVKTMLLLMGPAALGSGVQQLNLLVDVIIASHIPNAVSYLYYADRITELPIGMIGVAVATVLLPTLSRQLKSGDKAAAQTSMNRALEIVLLFGLPATAGCMLIAEPIIRVLYLHGNFTLEDMVATKWALVAFGAGLPAFLAVKVFAPGFYANHDTKTPFKIAVVCVIVNLFFNLTLSGPMKHVGMATATSIASWVNLIMMVVILHRRSIFKPDALLKRRLSRLIAATGIMAVALLFIAPIAAPALLGHMVERSVALVALIGAAGVVFFLAAMVLGAYDSAFLHRIIKRKPYSEKAR
jgi:putative peptidoglycan lipid II flippase